MLVEVKKGSAPSPIHYANVVDGKKRLELVVSENYINVVVHNASHRAWRGMGKFYANLQEALEGYQSAAYRQMIEAGYSAINGNFG